MLIIYFRVTNIITIFELKNLQYIIVVNEAHIDQI